MIITLKGADSGQETAAFTPFHASWTLVPRSVGHQPSAISHQPPGSRGVASLVFGFLRGFPFGRDGEPQGFTPSGPYERMVGPRESDLKSSHIRGAVRIDSQRFERARDVPSLLPWFEPGPPLAWRPRRRGGGTLSQVEDRGSRERPRTGR